MCRDTRLVVFADVESFVPAATDECDATGEALEAVAAKGVPIVFCSTRTRAEIVAVQRQLGVDHPFVAESGAALFVPAGYFGEPVPHARRVDAYEVVEFGPPYADVAEALSRGASACGVRVSGFRTMSVDEVSAMCRVSIAEARRAKRREYTEPFQIVGPHDGEHGPASGQRARLAWALEGEGLRVTAGGAFDLAGPHVDEGIAITRLKALYGRAWGPVLTIGLGDQLADEALLSHVDVPIAPSLLRLPCPANRLALKTWCRDSDEHRMRAELYGHLSVWHPAPTGAM